MKSLIVLFFNEYACTKMEDEFDSEIMKVNDGVRL
jgi:hypothetical protein